MSADLQAILTNPDTRQRFAAQGYAAAWMPPKATQKRGADEFETYASVINSAKIQRE